jgi:hypothetical protein
VRGLDPPCDKRKSPKAGVQSSRSWDLCWWKSRNLGDTGRHLPATTALGQGIAILAKQFQTLYAQIRPLKMVFLCYR